MDSPHKVVLWLVLWKAIVHNGYVFSINIAVLFRHQVKVNKAQTRAMTSLVPFVYFCIGDISDHTKVSVK